MKVRIVSQVFIIDSTLRRKGVNPRATVPVSRRTQAILLKTSIVSAKGE